MTDWPSPTRLAALVEYCGDAVVVLNREGIIRWANPAFDALWGEPDVAPTGRVLADLVASEDAAAWQAFVDRLDAGAGGSQGTFRYRRRHGPAAGWMAVSGRNLLDEPAIGALVVYLRDITAAHETALAQQLAPDRYRELFEDATDIIFETDAEGQFTLINPSALDLFGYTADEVIGRRFTEFVRDDHRPLVFEHYRRQVAQGQRASYIEFPALARGEREVWLGQNAWLNLDASGRYRGMRAVARDIGERRRADEALRHAQKMEAVGRLAGGIAHDFNNLLAAIRGNAEFLRHHLRNDPARVADVTEILQATDRAATMTRQLLTFSRKQEHRPVRLDVNALAESVARLSRRLLGPQITLDVDATRGVSPVLADAALLEQLVLNLILNARDAIATQGTVTVRTGNCDLPDGRPESARADLPAGPYVRLQVIDSGVGMDEATQARIFEPFFTTKEPGRGTGLGLSTVYGIVRQMGGAVTVLSARHHGATFSVYLPAAVDIEEPMNA